MRPFIEAFVKGRFSLLLFMIVAMFFVVPLVGKDQGVIDEVFGWFSIAVLVSCLRAIARTRGYFIFMTALTVLNVILSGSEIVVKDESHGFLMAVLGFKIIYFILVFLGIMRFVLNRDAVDGDKICGAIAAYLLMGMIWSFIYTAFFHINPASISVPEAWLSSDTINSYWSIYFSFTTLTTLGYGDVTPQTPLTQSYAVMQAAIGQIFLAVIVARLIALHISYERQ
ncbi:potassium channel family protein [Pontiellaceae bacterium B12227]|nr:potassium channel family protein [Pontiellaceae bacterium B12227]